MDDVQTTIVPPTRQRLRWISGGGIHDLLPGVILAPGRYLVEQMENGRWRLLAGDELARAADELAAANLGLSHDAFVAQRAAGEAEHAAAAVYGLLPQHLREATQIAERESRPLVSVLQHDFHVAEEKLADLRAQTLADAPSASTPSRRKTIAVPSADPLGGDSSSASSESSESSDQATPAPDQ